MTSKARQLADLGGDTANLEDISSAYTGGALSNRNLIINGAFQVAQRGTTSTAEDFKTVDRFRTALTGTDELAFTQSQDTDAPDGFAYSYKFTTNTPESSFTTNEWVNMVYGGIEGQDIQHLDYGTSAAKQITLSFWVKSNVTGTYASLLYRQNSVRGITKNYTINAADTWEYKTITFDGDTAVGINNDNTRGIQVYWTLSGGPDRKTTAAPSWQAYDAGQSAYGQTADVAGTTGGYFQLTGVQLEVGDTATPFEYRSYGQELALCQRYFAKSYDDDTVPGTGTQIGAIFQRHESGADVSNRPCDVRFPQQMRGSPTVTLYSAGNGASGAVGDFGSNYSPTANITGCSVDGTIGRSGFAKILLGTAFDQIMGFHYTADAEL